jgi:hypothetical protein
VQTSVPQRRPKRLAAAIALSLGCAALAAAATPWSERRPGRPVAPDGGILAEVHNCNDSGPESLRDAYENHGTFTDVTIDLTQLACSTITLTSGALVGSGTADLVAAPDHPVTIDGNQADRLFSHNGDLHMENLTITRGHASNVAGGGCLLVNGSAYLDHVTVTGCDVATSGAVRAYGGAIRAGEGVVMTSSTVSASRAHSASNHSAGGGIFAKWVNLDSQSTVSGNTASGDGAHYARGGGIYATESVTFLYTTVSGNHAISGGGAYIKGTQASSQIVNSTISGNRADGAGGGILSANASIAILNSTVTGNSAYFDFGAGLYLAAGNATLRSTIVADNTAGDGLNLSDIGGHAGAVLDGDHDLVTQSTLTLPSDTIMQEPLLGPLQDNGGGVMTHALLPGSPAIDNGTATAEIEFDERGPGYRRRADSEVDIGAFEARVDRIFANGFEAL